MNSVCGLQPRAAFSGCAETEGVAGDEFRDGRRRDMRVLGVRCAAGVWDLQAALPSILDACGISFAAQAGVERGASRLTRSVRIC